MSGHCCAGAWPYEGVATWLLPKLLAEGVGRLSLLHTSTKFDRLVSSNKIGSDMFHQAVCGLSRCCEAVLLTAVSAVNDTHFASCCSIPTTSSTFAHSLISHLQACHRTRVLCAARLCQHCQDTTSRAARKSFLATLTNWVVCVTTQARTSCDECECCCAARPCS